MDFEDRFKKELYKIYMRFENMEERLARLEEREFKQSTCQKLHDRLSDVEKYLDPDKIKLKLAVDELVKQAQDLKMGY